MIFIEKSLENKDEIILKQSLENDNNIDNDVLIEATISTIILNNLYPKVETILNDIQSNRKFQQMVGNYIDRNNEKLRTPGPQYLIPFTDNDKLGFFQLFNIEEKEVVSLIVEITSKLNGSDFKYLRQNPVFWLFWSCIRYFTVKKDSKGLNASLAIYALAVYPSIFHKYFKYEVSRPGVMEYTIDNLTNKFIVKQQGHIFGALTYSIQQSYKFLQPGIIKGSDDEVIRFIQRIRNDQNSMIKKICEQYHKNLEKGLTVINALDTGDSGEIIDSYVNDTSQVQSTVNAIVMPLITNGLNLKYVEIAAKMAQISVSDTRLFLSKIVVNEQNENITKFIESILFVWLYDEKHTRQEINTTEFLLWSSRLFRRTNSNNENLINIKNILNYWGDMSGLHDKFTREASRINYKKAVFYYFILNIQYYNH